MPKLHDFLATGSLGPLHFGMTADEIVAALGQPDGEAVQRKQRGLKYGALQLWLQRIDTQTERLSAVFLYFGTGGELPAAVRFAEAVPVTRDAVSAWLAAMGIKPVKETTDPVAAITLSSCVTFTFDEGALHLISCSAQESREPHRKQLTVSLPIKVFAELHARAKRDRRSVADTAATLLTAGMQASAPPE